MNFHLILIFSFIFLHKTVSYGRRHHGERSSHHPEYQYARIPYGIKKKQKVFHTIFNNFISE